MSVLIENPYLREQEIFYRSKSAMVAGKLECAGEGWKAVKAQELYGWPGGSLLWFVVPWALWFAQSAGWLVTYRRDASPLNQ